LPLFVFESLVFVISIPELKKKFPEGEPLLPNLIDPGTPVLGFTALMVLLVLSIQNSCLLQVSFTVPQSLVQSFNAE